MAGRKKGTRKTGGRKRGTPNKNTLVLDTFAHTIIAGGMEKFQTELNKLEGENFVNAFLKVYEYVKPKLQRTTHVGDRDNPIIVTGFTIVDEPESSKTKS